MEAAQAVGLQVVEGWEVEWGEVPDQAEELQAGATHPGPETESKTSPTLISAATDLQIRTTRRTISVLACSVPAIPGRNRARAEGSAR